MTPTWIIHFIPCGQPSYHTHGLNRYGSLELELNLPLEPRQAMLFINLIANEVLLPNKNIGNLVEQKESGDPIRRML